MTQSIRGRLFPAGGVGGVATRPGARRKGYCRRVMAALLAAEHEAGRAVSLLYPFRGSFYERLGYVTFPQPRMAKFDVQNLAPLLKRDFGGSVDIRPIAESFEEYYLFAQQVRATTHGMALFDDPDRAYIVKQNRTWFAQADIGGQPAGIMLYELRGERIMEFDLRATRFYAGSAQARYLLLQWIAGHIDQARNVEIWLAAFEFPETWLADLRPRLEAVHLAPMGRVLNIAALQGLPVGAGRICARIEDPLCPWNTGEWSLQSVDGTLEVARGGSPDCELAIQGLSALVYGVNRPDEFGPLGWGRVPAGQYASLAGLFPPAVPHLHEFF